MGALKRFMANPVDPIIYIFTFLSGYSGAIYFFSPDSPETQGMKPFEDYLTFDIRWWGLILLAAALVMILGLTVKWRSFVMAGALVSFCSYIPLAIFMGVHSLWLSLVGLLANLMIFGYVYAKAHFHLIGVRHRKLTVAK